MAENKKSVLLYVDVISTVEKLSDATAGMLFKHLLRYVNDLNPEPPNETVDLVFEPIKQQLKRDLKKWEKTIIGKSEGGKKAMEKRWGKSITPDKTVINKDKIVKDSIRPITDNVNVSVNVNDTVNVKDINLLFPPFSDKFLESWKLLLTQKKWKKKSPAALQASLNKLGKHSEAVAIQMIENTIAGEWQGIFEIKTDTKIKTLEPKGKIETMLTNYEIAKGL